VVVSDAFLKQNPIEKGVMTLVLGLIVQFGVTDHVGLEDEK
jgi:hypothetical protein